MSPKSKNPISNQQAITSYLTTKKRKSDTVDLTSDNSCNDDEQPPKKLKPGNFESPFFQRTGSINNFHSDIPKYSSEERARRAEKWRYSGPSEPHRDEAKASSDSFRGSNLARSSQLGAKLRRRYSFEVHNTAETSKAHDVVDDVASSVPALNELKKFAVDGPSSSKGSKGKGKGTAVVIGPEGLPCTPLEEAVS